jgi:hypothetical protein
MPSQPKRAARQTPSFEHDSYGVSHGQGRRCVQDLVSSRSSGFESPLRHHARRSRSSPCGDIADSNVGVSVAANADGKYVYVAGPHGVVISDDFGKTGSWVQTVRLK